MDPGADALIKAVVADFGTAEGRSAARDGLKDKLQDSKPPEIKEDRGGNRCQSAGRRGGLQGLVATNKPTRCRGCQGGGISRDRRRDCERSREGNPRGNLERTQVTRGLSTSHVRLENNVMF